MQKLPNSNSQTLMYSDHVGFFKSIEFNIIDEVFSCCTRMTLVIGMFDHRITFDYNFLFDDGVGPIACWCRGSTDLFRWWISRKLEVHSAFLLSFMFHFFYVFFYVIVTTNSMLPLVSLRMLLTMTTLLSIIGVILSYVQGLNLLNRVCLFTSSKLFFSTRNSTANASNLTSSFSQASSFPFSF